MPAQKRPWSHQKHNPGRARQVAGCGCQQRPISSAEPRPRDLPTQDLELVTQHQQLDVFHVQAAAATNKRTEQSPHNEVEEREDHAADPPNPRPKDRGHQFWRPSRQGYVTYGATVHDSSWMAGGANQRYLDALAFAESRHRFVKQARKGTTFPYLVHPLRVAAILDRFGCSEDAVVAGFLHDTLEDAGARYDDIASKFGQHVARLVEKASEPDKSLPWDVRKQHTIDHAKVENDGDALDLIAADKLDNVRSLVETLDARGRKETWRIFNADEQRQSWYYRTLAAALLERKPESTLMRALSAEVEALFPDPQGRASASWSVGTALE